jgi:hypothetical protein
VASLVVQVQIEFIRDAGINPILMLSLVDNMQETGPSRQIFSLRKNAMAPSPRLRELMRHTATMFNVPLNMVTYTVNYESETRRDFNIERLCLKNLIMVGTCESVLSLASSEPPTRYLLGIISG